MSGTWGRPPCYGYSFERENEVLKDELLEFEAFRSFLTNPNWFL